MEKEPPPSFLTQIFKSVLKMRIPSKTSSSLTSKHTFKAEFKLCISLNQAVERGEKVEHTFTFISGFIQDGLGRHNLAIPSKTGNRRQNESEWLRGQRGGTATYQPSHTWHTGNTKSAGVKHEHESSVARHDSASVWLPLSTADGAAAATRPEAGRCSPGANTMLSQACNLHPHRHSRVYTHTLPLSIFGPNAL